MGTKQNSSGQQIIAYKIRNNLYLNITDHCTLRCNFCPKFNGSNTVKGYDLSLNCTPSADDLIQAIGDPKQYNAVVFCGFGEPTLRLKTVLEVAKFVKSRGGKTRLNTDGLANLVHKRNVLEELKDLIDAISVSMNASVASIYDLHCRPQIPGTHEAMLTFLTRAPYYIDEVTATAIEGLDGVDINDCRNLSNWLGVKFRVRQLNEIG